MSETPEGFWREVQRFVQAEIARAHKAQAIAPNVPYGSVVMDQHGHVVHAAAGGGGATNESVRFHQTSSQTFTSGSEIVIDFDTQDWDALNAVTTGSGWNYDNPFTGHLLVIAAITLTGATWSAGVGTSLHTYINGSAYNTLDRKEFAETSASRRMLHGCDIIPVNPGDLVDFRFRQDSGSNRTTNGLAGLNYCSITFID